MKFTWVAKGITYLLLIVFTTILVTKVHAQTFSSPLIHNYSSKEYGAHTQNWCVVQDSLNLMYIGNNNGVVRYDGENWFLIETDGIVRSMVKSSLGEIYVGTQGNFGKLIFDSLGVQKYHSIYNSIRDSVVAADSIDFGDIWNTVELNGKIYFQSKQVVFEWNPITSKINYWLADTSSLGFHVAFAVEGELYVKYVRGEMLRLSGNELVGVNNSEEFGNYHVFAMLPYSKDTLLLGTYRNSMLKYSLSSGVISPFPTEADDFFNNNGIFNGRFLGNHKYFLGTLNGGGCIIDNHGRAVQYITANQGLQSAKVKQSWIDNDRNLWLALNNGFSKVEINSPWTVWNEDQGLDTKIYNTLLLDSHFLVATPVGAFYKKQSQEMFEPIEEIKGQTWGWEPYTKNDGSKAVVVANQNYIGSWDFEKLEIIKPEVQVYFVKPSQRFKNRYYYGTSNGLSAVEYTSEGWKYLGKFANIDVEMRELFELENGDLWVSSAYDGIYRLSNISEEFGEAQITIFDTLSGLSGMRESDFLWYKDTLYIGQDGGLFKYNPTLNTIEPSALFEQWIPNSDSTGFREFTFDNQGNLWVKTVPLRESVKYLHLLKKTGNQDDFEAISTPFKRIEFGEIIDLNYVNNFMYISSSEGLFVYNYSNEYTSDFAPTVAIRKIEEGEHNIIYNGIGKDLSNRDQFTFTYDRNSLRFHFSSPSYIQENSTEYSYFLEGFDQHWSDWTSDNHKEYTNLDPNDQYSFKIKSRNIFGLESEVSAVMFRINKPWYLEWYFLILYGLIAALIIYGLVKFNTARLKRKNELLERIVSERTKEIQEQKDQIESQKIQVEEANEELNQINEEILSQRDQIEHQNKTLTKQNHDILSSISYASKIQRAILPSKSLIDSNLPDSYFLYMPKDIVSGDFYWMETIGNKVLWAAVDCTGHGVPGAFMSILGSNGLKQIVRERGILKPSEILEQLTEHVINSMTELGDGKNLMDGMDIALCCWDKSTGVLEFSGAYNPLYLIRDKELVIYKGTRRPVGRHYVKKRKDFINHTIELQKGDLIYIFSDGYPDQFGGPTKDKFTYARLKQTILDSHALPMEEQEIMMRKTLEEWMQQGNEPQLDDICFIGVKVDSPTVV